MLISPHGQEHTLIAPLRRVHFFALLSGAMMTGIGTAPITGRIVTSLSLPILTTLTLISSWGIHSMLTSLIIISLFISSIVFLRIRKRF